MRTFKQYLNLINEYIFESIDVDSEKEIINENVIYDTLAKSMGNGNVKIYSSTPSLKQIFIEPSNGHKVYFKDGGTDFEVHKYDNSIVIQDISDAMERGKQCKYLSIQGKAYDDRPSIIIYNYMDDNNIKSVSEFIKLVEKNDMRRIDIPSDPDKGVYINIRTQRSVDTFSPFKLFKLKRLTKIPNKIKSSDVIKALINGQYDLITRDFSYTDDYAYDAVYGGEVKGINPISLAYDMFGEKWSVWSRSQEDMPAHKLMVMAQPHSNKSYTIIIDIKAKHKLTVR